MNKITGSFRVAMDDLNIKIEFSSGHKDIVIIHIGGYVDQTNSRNIDKVISDILKTGKRKIVFNLSELIYMSSAGWGIFVGNIKIIRNLGGDLKIAGMSPEVYEVYQMLEFYHIIQDYVTLEDAVESFYETAIPVSVKQKTSNNLEPDSHSLNELFAESGIKTSLTEEKPKIVSDRMVSRNREKVESKKPEIAVESSAGEDFKPFITEKEIDIKQLPLHEKIRKIVANYPLLNLFEIRKFLRHEKFGSTSIGIYKLYRMLKEMNLDTKKSRYRYYRSV